jgi:predicted DNA-binding transcriptional regulator AlpA
MKAQQKATQTSSLAKLLPACAQRATPRRGLNRAEASLYVGVSPSKFDELVKDGRMCSPKRIDGRVIWDIRQLDEAFDCLPCDDKTDSNPWDEP